MISAGGSPASGNSILLASATAVDGQAAAPIALTFESGITAANAFPEFVIIDFNSGVVDACSITVQCGGANILGAGSPLAGISSARYYIAPVLEKLIRNTGTYQVTNAVINVAAFTYNIKVYGIKR